MADEPQSVEILLREVARARADADMFARAWARELKRPLPNKQHLIDALCMATREVVNKAMEREAGLPIAVIQWRDAERVSRAADAAVTARERACREASIREDAGLERAAYRTARDAASVALEAMAAALGCLPPAALAASLKGDAAPGRPESDDHSVQKSLEGEARTP